VSGVHPAAGGLSLAERACGCCMHAQLGGLTGLLPEPDNAFKQMRQSEVVHRKVAEPHPKQAMASCSS